MSKKSSAFVAVGLAALLASSVGAEAEGYPPFYGYSGYYGGPAVYYTHDLDVHQSTTPRDGDLGYGIRTYTTGGPFWGYKRSRTVRQPQRYRQHGAVRVRG